MKTLSIFIFVLLVSIVAGFTYVSHSPDNNLIKYYSTLLTLNLNHSSEAAKVIYSLSKEPVINKDFLEDQLDKIQQNVEYANNNIASITINTLTDQKKSIDQYLKNIDDHLSAVFIDIETIRTNLKKKEDISSYISDIYYQIKKAENEDHREIKRILNLKEFDEPVLVVPEQQ
ncbi:MAG: hypothetical protein OQK63_07385 [Ignavibacteriaceae bacterium]|nr:hypothetical protein [Chlorobium sp.]MCW8823893.1 hypothetical protein [Ignavibacteriaceae bacterium]